MAFWFTYLETGANFWIVFKRERNRHTWEYGSGPAEAGLAPPCRVGTGPEGSGHPRASHGLSPVLPGRACAAQLQSSHQGIHLVTSGKLPTFLTRVISSWNSFNPPSPTTLRFKTQHPVLSIVVTSVVLDEVHEMCLPQNRRLSVLTFRLYAILTCILMNHFPH